MEKCLKPIFSLNCQLWRINLVEAYNKNEKNKFEFRQKGRQNGSLLQIKYKKISPETGKLQGLACKMLILLILELQTSSL